MDERILDMGTDWEEALHVFEKVIVCDDKVFQIRALLKLARISKDVPPNILACAVPILVELFNRSTNTSSLPVQEATAYCLKRIVCRGDGELAVVIGQSGVVPSLLRSLEQSEGWFRRLLIKFLWVLVNLGSPNRVTVARNGGLEIIINIARTYVGDGRRILLEILSALALLREVRRVIIGFGGLPFLVESAGSGSPASKARAAHAIGLLGQTRRVKQMLVDLNVMPILIELLREGDNLMKLVAGNSLGIIASHVDYFRAVAQAGAIPLYIDLLLGPEPLGREIAEDVFCILSVVEVNARSITEHLVRILRSDNDGAKSAVTSALWDLSGYKHSATVVRESGAIPILVELLQNGNGDVRENAFGAIAQLSYDEVGRRTLAGVGVIPILLNLFQGESEVVTDIAAEILINFSEDPLFRDRVSEAYDNPSFQIIQSRLLRLRASDEHMVRSLSRLSIEHLTWDPNLV